MNPFRRYKIDFLIVAGFLLLPLLLYGPVTVGGRTMLPADNLFQWQPWASAAAQLGGPGPHNSLISDLILENYAWKRFIQDSIRAGEIPLWNPYLLAGAPFLANGQHSAYYPFSLLFLVLPLAKAYGWYTVSQLWLAGALAYFFGRVLGLRRGGAAVMGLIYQGGGFMIVSAAVFPMIVGAAAWLPLLLACVEMVIRQSSGANGGRTLPWVVLGAVALGCQVLAGHVEITYYSLLVMAGYGVWGLGVRGWQVAGGRWQVQNPKSLVRPATWLMALVAAGLLLGAIQLIPLMEVLPLNFREGSATLAEVRSWAYPPRHALALLMPNVYGNPTHHEYRDVFSGQITPFTTNYYGVVNPHGLRSSDWGIKNYVEGGIYLGILPLLLAGWGVWVVVAGGRGAGEQGSRGAGERVADGRWQVMFFLVLGLLCLAFMFGTPLYALLYYGLPGINQLHSPFRWVFPFSLCVAVLAGVGLDYLDGGRRTKDGGKSFVLRLSSFVFLSGVLILTGLLLSRLFYGRLEPFIERIFLALAQAPDAFPDARAFYSYEFWQVLILGLMVTAAGLLLRYLPSALPAFLLILLDLFLAGRGFNAAVDPVLVDYKPALVEWLEQRPGLWRLTTFAPHGDKPLNANTPWLYDFQDVRGYDSIILKQYTEYMAAIEPQKELAYNRVQPITHWESLNSPLLDLLGVKYIVTAETLNLPKLTLAWEGEGLKVYENLAAVPRAFTLPQTATAVVPEPLAAMRELDPRQYVVVGTADGGRRTEAIPQPPTPSPQPLSPAEVVHYSNLEVQVEATVGEPSWLVLNDTYFQGWKAYGRPVGGDEEQEREIPLYRVNGNFRGVLLEPGSWLVRFRYSPLSFKLGGLVSLLSGLTILFAAAVWLWRRFYNPQAKLTNTRSIAKNSLIPMGLNLFNRLIDFIFAAFYLRLLGPADAGRYATAIAIAGWFEIVSNFGLNTLVIREVAQDKSQAGRYLLNTSILRLGTTALGALPVVIYVAGVGLAGNPLDAETVAAILLISLGMIFSGWGQGLAGLFYAFEVAERPAAVATMTTLLKVGFGVVALLLGYGFVGLAAVSIVVNVITLGILAAAAGRLLRGQPGAARHLPAVDWRLQGEMFGRSYPLMLNHLFAVIFFQIDVPLLRQFNGETVVGWYNSAYKWVNAINVIPSFFTFALFPVISRQVQSSLDDARRTFRMAIKLMVLVALPVAAVTTLLAPLLIRVLGGPAFLPDGAVALQIVIWSIPFGWLNSVTNYVLIALGQERMQTRAFLVGVTFNVVANLIFLPRYSYVAAAVITILSEVVLLVVFDYYLRQRLPDVQWGRIVARPAAVTVLTLGAMGLGYLVHPLLALGLAVVTYPAGLWLLRVFGEEEGRIVRALLPTRLRMGRG